MSDDLVLAKTVQTSPIRTLAEGLKSMLVEMNLVFDKDGIKQANAVVGAASGAYGIFLRQS